MVGASCTGFTKLCRSTIVCCAQFKPLSKAGCKGNVEKSVACEICMHKIKRILELNLQHENANPNPNPNPSP